MTFQLNVIANNCAHLAFVHDIDNNNMAVADVWWSKLKNRFCLILICVRIFLHFGRQLWCYWTWLVNFVEFYIHKYKQFAFAMFSGASHISMCHRNSNGESVCLRETESVCVFVWNGQLFIDSTTVWQLWPC